MPIRLERNESYLLQVGHFPQPVRPANGSKFTLEEMQKAVGGHVELAYRLSSGHTLWCDEEGKLKNKMLNFMATLLYWESGTTDVIVGDALLIAEGQVD